MSEPLYNTNPEFPRNTEEVTILQDPLHLDLSDERLVNIIDDRHRDFDIHVSKNNLKERRNKIRDYLRGKQVDERIIDSNSIPYVENTLFEAHTRVKPIALSRLPDLLAKPGNETEESRNNAEALTKLMNNDLKKEVVRRVLGKAFQDRPVNLISAIKAVWNPQLGTDGDYEFVNVHIDNLKFDYAVPEPDPDKMEYISESREVSVKEILMQFPDKKEELLNHLAMLRPDDKRSKDAKLATKLTVWETWFHWYEEEIDEMTQQKKWVRIDGTVWKYQHIILGKMKHPYWDWEGRKNYFDPNIDIELSEDDLYEKMFPSEQPLETIYHNYFRQPKKPYYFMTYFRSGEDAFDFTSEYEQVLTLQDNINVSGRQIFDMNSRSKGKFIFASQLIDQETAEQMDIHDYNQALVIDTDDARKGVNVFQPQPAPTQLYNSKQENRSIAFEMMALNATTRGVREGGEETLGSRQMMREQDFGVIDDMVEEMVNDAARWMARWALQFIKLFYTRNHMVTIVGTDGDSLHVAINQDMVEDGMEVEISASGVDKMRRRREALEIAQMGLGDPLTFFEDIGASNAKERARRSVLFKMAPQMYMQEYLMGEGGEEQQMMMPPQPQSEQPPMV